MVTAGLWARGPAVGATPREVAPASLSAAVARRSRKGRRAGPREAAKAASERSPVALSARGKRYRQAPVQSRRMLELWGEGRLCVQIGKKTQQVGCDIVPAVACCFVFQGSIGDNDAHTSHFGHQGSVTGCAQKSGTQQCCEPVTQAHLGTGIAEQYLAVQWLLARGMHRWRA